MIPKPVPGRPSELTPERYKLIIELLPRCLTPNIVGKMARVPKQTLWHWLSRGRQESLDNISTIYSQFSDDFDAVVASQISKMLDRVLEGKPGWQGSHEILKAVARDDFGQDAGIIQELINKLIQLETDLKKYIESPLKTQGGINNGEQKEVDSRCDEE